ncbi:hypothetical protein CO610_02890 [Lysobacteraceae bacterium NML95-0200]|nr:hypothetical protein CO612_05810 [Xanthomonadaceae bacterium NML71-0210]PJK09593.1 hypothetical protein CO610_02890 [Xanthomonadaceae bacterium NML95-0200]
MSHVSPGRIAILASLLASVALVSGCGWFRKDNDSYKLSGEARPLELPPEFSRPDTSGAMALPGQSVMASSQAAQAAPSQPAAGFVVAGSRDEVFARIGQVLDSVEGVQVASRAQLLGSHDVSYQGSNFLVRAVQTGDTVYVSIIDPRGVPQTGAAATQLLATLKQALGGQ